MKRLVVVAVTVLLVTAGFAFADSDPVPPSNTSAVTGSIFEEANDKFLSPTDFSELDSSVLFLQFDMPGGGSGPYGEQGFEIGAGTTLSDIYIGGYYGAAIPGKQGLLGGDESTYTNVNETFQLDGSGVITGRTTTRDVETHYRTESLNELRALVGLGSIGVGLEFYQESDSEFGSFQPTYTLPGPGPTAWNGITVNTASQVATTVTSENDAGELVSVVSEEYGLGEDADNGIYVDLKGGTTLEAMGMQISPQLDLATFISNESETAAFETFSRTVGAATSIAYTPTTSLTDEAPTEITDLTSYEYAEATENNSFVLLLPSVSADVEMPMNEALTLTGGLGYDFQLPLYRSTYMDNAGAEQTVSGRADYYSSTVVNTAVNGTDPSLTEVTTTTTTAWETEEISRNQHTFTPSVGVEVMPTERFRFGVSYWPRIMLQKTTNAYAGEAVEVQTIENGDGSSGEDDSVTETTVSRSGYTVVDRDFEFENRVNTGAQFFLIPERLRINLGAEVTNLMIDRRQSETVTDGVLTREVREADDTTEPAEEDYVVTDSEVYDGVRANPDASRTTSEAGNSSVNYDAGLTFFFDESMFLDLSMNGGGGNIWDTTTWSLEMTILF